MSGLDSIIDRRGPSAWDLFIFSPTLYVAQLIHAPHTTPITSPNSSAQVPVRLVCISDTHSTHSSQPPLPAGDILIHAGDLTHSGTLTELESALSWLAEQPHLIKLYIAGNHDMALADPIERERLLKMFEGKGLTYLEDEKTTVDVRGRKLRVYGSPRTPKHGSWPFQYPRAPVSASSESNLWSSIPYLTDILITHGPPLSHLDCINLGCAALLAALWRVRPRVHVFGHVHAGRGVEVVGWSRAQKAYEGVCRGGGLVGLMRLAWWVLVERIGGWVWKESEVCEETGTILVNAAAVGGFRDDKRLGAIVVDI